MGIKLSKVDLLNQAIKKDHNDSEIAKLIDECSNENILNNHDSDGYTPLMTAVFCSSLVTLDHLLSVPDLDINKCSDKYCQSALDIAIAYHRMQCAGQILEDPRILKDLNSAVNNYVENAANIGNIEMVESLVDKGAYVSDTILHSIASALVEFEGHRKCVKLLIPYSKSKGKNIVNFKNKKGETPLIVALKHKKMELCHLLLEQGARISDKKEEEEDCTNILHLLVKNDFQPDAVLVMVDAALAAEVQIDARNELGETPLMLAAKSGIPYLLQYFIDKNANVDAVDRKKNTALHLIMKEYGKNKCDGHAKCVRYLIVANANTLMENSFNQTPLMLAEKHGFLSVIFDLKVIAYRHLEIQNFPDLRPESAEWQDKTYSLKRQNAINPRKCLSWVMQ